MDNLGIKPNFAALGRKYGLDWRTVKKYHSGYEGKPSTRNKKSRLDEHHQEIADKFKIKRINVKGVYEFMVKKYGLEQIGSYSNFNKYVKKNQMNKSSTKEKGHPRYEKEPGMQGQVDWKEDISIRNRHGETFVINIFHIVLKYSRFSYIEMSAHKRFEDVARCLVNAFFHFGGVPKELLFDNMSTVANIQATPKKPTGSVARLAKDCGFRIRLCGTRSPETKGTVEAKNKVLDWIRAYDGDFETLEELDAIVRRLGIDMNTNICQETGMSPMALFYKEKNYLGPLPAKEVTDAYILPNRYMVLTGSLISYDGSRYSVPPELIGLEVTVDRLGDRLYIYHEGKLAAYHEANKNPINYRKEDYSELMKGKVVDAEMEDIVQKNLATMDRLLESRTFEVSEEEAAGSVEALMAYLGQGSCGRWIIDHFAHLSDADKGIFVQGMNSVLPYVGDREEFISNIKYSMKADLCRTLALDCYIKDLMAADRFILTDEGYRAIGARYQTQINDFIEELKKQHDTDDGCKK